MAERRIPKILIVDDEPHIRELLSRWLEAEGYECDLASDGDMALGRLGTDDFQLAIIDIMMPGMNGVDLLTAIRALYRNVAVVMVTAVDDRKTAVLTLEIGAYGYVIKPFHKNEILIGVASALERRRLTLLSEAYERSLEEEVAQRTQEVRDREEDTIFRLVSALGYRDTETGAHVRRIGLHAAEIARYLGWERERVGQIRLAAPMHDVGKIGIPDSILLKPGPLSPEEAEIMKKHTDIGGRLLAGSKAPMLQMAMEIAWCHHERWNGSGYPRRLAGEAIPEAARIVTIVDVYDALTHDRSYRPAFTELKAYSMMHALRAEAFDPRIFDCFMEVLPSLRAISEELGEDVPPEYEYANYCGRQEHEPPRDKDTRKA
ncbi:MAG: HD domain-containing phosphohydrolase [Thermodesulfobacteriota bacterium]